MAALKYWDGTKWVTLPSGVAVYEQATDPGAVSSGSIWIDQSADAPVAVPLVTTLPAAPIDGQEVYFLADAANGVVWHLRYRAASSSAYKWEYLGGTELFRFQTEAEIIYSTSVERDVVGASLTMPLTGEYNVEFGGYIRNQAGGSYSDGLFGVRVGSLGTVGPYAKGRFMDLYAGAAVTQIRRFAMSVGDLLKLCVYSYNGVSVGYDSGWFKVRPVRVG